VVLMSAPFAGPPVLPFNTAHAGAAAPATTENIHAALAALPRPRKHYQWYYSTREANANMHACPQGVHAFLRAYYHMKSADWQSNTPFPLQAWRADELAKMPTYYIMDLWQGMAETVAPEMPSAADIAACTWLPEEELVVYSTEYSRTGFQGGLQWYRCATGGKDSLELQLFSGRTIDVPSMFIAGKSDWGVYQRPGNFERMQNYACTAMRACHLLDGVGHWVQQEQPERVNQLLTQFLHEQAYGQARGVKPVTA
jgi:pimeloyl-ACP methyl ester carboxylesterase